MGFFDNSLSKKTLKFKQIIHKKSRIFVKYQNKLVLEKSPYLLQHSENPVDWFPWGEEAFEKSRKEDKLIFLSIGYSTCHWCHVMEKESFEDKNTARILNEHFVSIKVDREERPDIDSIYMDAIHAMGQQGGWPLNVFLTPDKKPVAGGTYFPKIPMHGKKSFLEVLDILKDAWKNKKEELIGISEGITSFLSAEKENPNENQIPEAETIHKCFTMYERFFDKEFGGFLTNSANKFPPSLGLIFLLKYSAKFGIKSALEMCVETLSSMKKGGIYDQIGGGICRYATDRIWLVPHFEKMLYDNALFLQALSECYRMTKKSFFKDAAYEIVSYINRDMKLPDFGISSAEDADSEGEEGKFYTWSLEEFRSVVNENSPILEKFWNVTQTGNFEGNNILNESLNVDFCKMAGLNQDECQLVLCEAKTKLLNERSKRIRPLRDDKILTSWNCLYIRALLNAGSVFSDKQLVHDAVKIYAFLEGHLFTDEKRLLRRFRNGEGKLAGYLNDYAEFGLASVYLYRLTFDTLYIKNASFIAKEIIRLFSSDEGAFYSTGIDGEKLIRRPIEGYDGVEPSGNSSAAVLFLKLAGYGINPSEYRLHAERIFSYFGKMMKDSPIAYPAMFTGFLELLDPYFEIAIIGDKNSAKVQEVLNFLQTEYYESSVAFSDASEIEENSLHIPLLKNRKSEEEVTIYVCRNGACVLPVFQLEELVKVLNS
ncbi:MAG: thioredoxin domain-containing protein [Leptospiraceae bacterium]|nr:thioredoxin domain-containing protein [Leptospiraceae bacterium]